jgi:CHC2 zinc finger
MITATRKTDAELLAERFNLAELRRELHHAEVNFLPDWPGYEYWLWYADIVRTAIEIKKARRPVARPVPGYVDVESIKGRADILTIIESYDLKVRKAGHNFKCCCPFHNERTPSFIINPDKQSWHCFGACATGGDVFSFVMKIENCDFKTAAIKVGDLL